MDLIFPQVLIPGGEFVILNPPNGSTSYIWVADVKEGTDLLFFMVDSQGNQGGISDIEQVSLSSDTSCLNVNSPSSTASAPSVTSSQSTPSAIRSDTTSVGIIAGSTVGGVVFLGLIIAISICYRRKASRLSNSVSMFSPTRLKYDDYKAEEGGNTPQIQPFPYLSDSVNHLVLPIPPRNRSRATTAFASDPFTQHLREISCSNGFAGGPYPNTRTTATGDQALAVTSSVLPYQTLPVGLAPPIHPGSYSPLTNTSPANFTSNNTHARFSSIQSSPMSPNINELSGHGDSASSPLSLGSRQITAIAGQTPPPNYLSAYQTYSLPPIQSLPLHASVGSVDISGPPAQSSPLSFTTDAIPHSGDAASMSFPCGINATSAGHSTTGAPAQIIVHTDIEDVQATSDDLGVVELPPQYADRQLLAVQPAPAQRHKSS